MKTDRLSSGSGVVGVFMKIGEAVQMNGIPFRRILIATDFSDASRNALRYAAAITRNHGSRLYIVHIVSSVGYKMVGADAEIQAAELAARELKELWNKLGGGDQSSAVELTLIVRRGEVCDQLEDLIQSEQIDLVVIGTHGRTGLSKVVLGSVAEDIFRNASCPVLTVGPSSDWDWPRREVGAEKAILFATDFGDASLKALPYAVSIANRSRSKLFLLHVAKLVTQTDQTPMFGSALERAEEECRESSVKRLKELIRDDLQIDHEIRVAFGLPVDRILGEVASSAAGLIVLGLHRKSRFIPSGHLPSTTAYEVVLGARCPVLTVRS
jgi:nucleotide-binding universal stress UspA family protein